MVKQGEKMIPPRTERTIGIDFKMMLFVCGLIYPLFLETVLPIGLFLFF
ncbi:hypothetical protein MTYM_01243 [Methylococcales bacterium]|nr:hypothetical protein MTYM_01243 [Methylococcales bacterium]